MSLKYFARYRFDGNDAGEEDYGLRDLAVESGFLTTFDDPEHGSCLSLDGATSLMSTGNFINISENSDRCFTFWAKFDQSTFSTSSPVLCYGDLSSPNAFVMYAKNEMGYPEFYDYQSRVAASSPSIPVDTWSFVAFACRAGVLSIFVDGIRRYSSSVVLSTGTSDPLRIGTDGKGEYYEGLLLDLRIWETSVDDKVIEYMYSVGPNYEENLSSMYVEDSSNRSSITVGNLLCRSSYGIQDEDGDGGILSESFFCVDESGEAREAARVEHVKDSTTGFGSNTIRIRDESSRLQKTIEMSPEITTFTSTDDTSSSSSIIFSSSGVHLSAGSTKGCFYFGAEKDFRIRVGNGSFLVEALSSDSNTYVTKMQVSP